MCLQKKPLSSFHINADAPDGKRSQCKPCRNKRSRQLQKVRYSKNPEKIKAQQKKWYMNNKDQIKNRKKEKLQIIIDTALEKRMKEVLLLIENEQEGRIIPVQEIFNYVKSVIKSKYNIT